MAVPFNPANKQMFNRDGFGTAVFNGFGTTKTNASPTLFVTNIPNGVGAAEIEAVFRSDPGFQRIRTVRRMVFVDYNGDQFATSAMQRHQNTKVSWRLLSRLDVCRLTRVLT
jgi:hypothetical protein